MILKVKTSEPRDALQSERTCLSFVRFSTTLFITSFGILLNFKLDSNSSNNLKNNFLNSEYTKALTYLLVCISILFLVGSCASYLVTIKRYKMGSIDNFGFNNIYNGILMGVFILVLIFINISLMVDSYRQSG
ncbi:hypothetical protein CLIB1444_02S10462 [[Candida] jaroonii]|uniref:Uncharacterized protein n=1 Tax=[Candida] jaroonii TaxID=467808 RepID=A0ACA9Y3H8_9ASCO|nr:hypothetical protein CLIB1444_02S10462 [[Candida] jaroonii]